MHAKELSYDFFERPTIKINPVIQIKAEKNLECSPEAKIGPHALLELDACASSKWPYKKTVETTAAKHWRLVL